jgi:hypothetical protein
MLIAISSIVASALVVAVYNFSLMRAYRAVKYRLFLIVYFTVWSSLLWMHSYKPTFWMLIVNIALIGILPVLASIHRRAPWNRRQTKALLDRLQQERRLKNVFGHKGKFFFWPVLWCLIWSVSYRIITIFFVDT